MTAKTADVAFVLVHPRNSGNVGSAVRVLRNFGFAPPRVVGMYRFSETEARQMAAGCEEDVANVEFYDDLESALADRVFVAGTTALKRTHWRLEPLDQAAARFTDAQLSKAAILFGNEKSGLSEPELTRCERLITIPTEGYKSMNLSHAVGLVAWELRKRMEKPREEPLPELAPREVVEPMLAQMEAALERISFLHPGQDDRVRIILRQMFTRNGLTKKDVQVLRGIWHQIDWLATTKKNGK